MEKKGSDPKSKRLNFMGEYLVNTLNLLCYRRFVDRVSSVRRWEVRKGSCCIKFYIFGSKGNLSCGDRP